MTGSKELIESARKLAPDAFGSTPEIEAASRLAQAAFADKHPKAKNGTVEENFSKASAQAKDASSDDGNAGIKAATLIARAMYADEHNKPEQAVKYLDQAQIAAGKAFSTEGQAEILSTTLIARAIHEDGHGDPDKASTILNKAEVMSQFAVTPDGKAQIQAQVLLTRAGLAEKWGYEQATQQYFDQAAKLAEDLRKNDLGTADGAAQINTAVLSARADFAYRHNDTAGADNYYKQADEAAQSGITADVRGACAAQILLSKAYLNEPSNMKIGSNFLLTGLTSMRPNLELLLTSIPPEDPKERAALKAKLVEASTP